VIESGGGEKKERVPSQWADVSKGGRQRKDGKKQCIFQQRKKRGGAILICIEGGGKALPHYTAGRRRGKRGISIP